MRHSLLAGLLWMLLLWQPVEISHSQTASAQDSTSKAIVNQKLRDTILKKQEIISELAERIPGKAKPIIKYVKVYKTVPVYYPEKDTITTSFKNDTLENDYIVAPPHAAIPVMKVRKKSFIYRIFHPKKRPEVIEKSFPEKIQEIIEAEDRLEND